MMKTRTVAVIGLGRYGQKIIQELNKSNVEVYAIDTNIERVNAIEAYSAVALDSTDKRALRSQDINNLDAVVVAIGENFEATLITVLHLIELGTKRILVRVSSAEQNQILQTISKDLDKGRTSIQIIYIEEVIANIVAEKIKDVSVNNVLGLPDGYEIVELKVPEKLLGKEVNSLKDNPLFKDIKLITVKSGEASTEANDDRENIYHITDESSNYILAKDDFIILFGKNEDIHNLDTVGN
jgi:trk system potassium uptake protein TrkA